MIKFFRNIRQQLLTENKIGRYLKYAIGEVALVVIGILIALTVNNNNEQRKTEEKITSIFEEIFNEISFDISKINGATAFYQKQDSLTYLVLNGKLTEENYMNNTPSHLFDFTSSNTNVYISNNAYNNLLQFSSEVPAKFAEILKDLEMLYQISKKRVDYLDTHMNELTIENVKTQYYNYPWATLQIPNNQNEGYIEYLLHDNDYKAIVLFRFESGIKEHLKMALLYKIRAISCYKKMAKLLNKPIDNTLFGYERDVVSLLTGTWKSNKDPEDNFRLFIGEHGLLTRKDKNSSSEINYFVGKNKIVTLKNAASYPIFYTIVKDKDELFLFENDGTVWNKR